MTYKNVYWVLRHGTSKANVKKLIVSDPANGKLPEYGLTDSGKAQASVSGMLFLHHLQSAKCPEVHIYASPFTRTLQTAEEVVTHLQRNDAYKDVKVQVADALRERFFGAALELQSSDAYVDVWEADLADGDFAPEGDGESVNATSARLAAFINELESRHSGCVLLLVSHGDTLSVLQAHMLAADLREHRRFKLDTAQLWCVLPQPGAAPEQGDQNGDAAAPGAAALAEQAASLETSGITAGLSAVKLS